MDEVDKRLLPSNETRDDPDSTVYFGTMVEINILFDWMKRCSFKVSPCNQDLKQKQLDYSLGQILIVDVEYNMEWIL